MPCLPSSRRKRRSLPRSLSSLCSSRRAVASHVRFSSVSSGLLLPPASPHRPREQFLELCREVRHYGCVQLDPCVCDYPEPGCAAVLSVGNHEISCRVTLPDAQTRDVSFQMNRVKCWQVTFLVSISVLPPP